jgi:hypothetical protein
LTSILFILIQLRLARLKELPMNRWLTTADKKAGTDGITEFVGAFHRSYASSSDGRRDDNHLPHRDARFIAGFSTKRQLMTPSDTGENAPGTEKALCDQKAAYDKKECDSHTARRQLTLRENTK